MRVIEHDGKRLAIWFDLAEAPEGLSFLSEDHDFIQAGTWRYPAGKRLLAHKHNEVARACTHSQELIFVLKGSLRAHIYTDEEWELEQLTLQAGECLVLLAGGHGYEVLEDDSVVLEVKNGPYPGPEADRRRFDPLPATRAQDGGT